jgi:N-methylhydantoinase B
LLAEVRQHLAETAAAMDTALRQAATSAGITRQLATAAAVHTPDGALVVGGRESHPLLLESSTEALPSLRAVLGDGDVGGDAVYACNDPAVTGAGLEDLVLVAPVAAEGSGWLVTLTAGHVGLGRATLAPVARLRREGMLLPWTRIGRRGRLDPVIEALLVANAETPEAFQEDLQAHLHCLELGRNGLESLLERLGPAEVGAACQALSQACRAPLQALLALLKGEPARGGLPPLAVEARAQGDGMQLALTGDAPAGVPVSLARAAARAAVRQMLAVETPSAGFQGDLAQLVRLQAEDHPLDGPTGQARFASGQAVAGAVLAAFAERAPHLTHAPDGTALLLDLRGQYADGRRYRLRLGLPGGSGASVYGDGLTHAGPAFSPHRALSVQEIERSFPVRILRLTMAPDSGGPGQYRGGLGSALELLLLEGRAQVDVLVPGRAWGLRGGMRGSVGRLVHVTPEDGCRATDGPALPGLEIRAGHRLVLESPGGGGWGMPFQRSIMRLEEDVARALISPEQSKNRYGVVLKPGTLEKDDHLTYRVRHYLLSTLAVEDIIAGEELLD